MSGGLPVAQAELEGFVLLLCLPTHPELSLHRRAAPHFPRRVARSQNNQSGARLLRLRPQQIDCGA